MKSYLNILFSVFCILLACQVLASQTNEKDVLELTRITKLEAEEYINARNEFLKSRTKPIDLDKAIEKGWKEGLLAFILNARIEKPNWFEGWDKAHFSMDIIGRIRWYPDPYPDEDKQLHYCNLYRTERLWKFKSSADSNGTVIAFDIIEKNRQKGIWPKQVMDDEIKKSRHGMLLPNNAGLWRKVASQSDNYNMMIIASQALAMDESKSAQELIETRLSSDSTDNVTKASIISGLYFSEPNYATSILMKTYNDWKQRIDPSETYAGFLILAKQPIDSDSYKFLREIILSEGEPEGIRREAILSLGTRREPNDYITTLRDVLRNSKSVVVRRSAAEQIASSPQSVSIPILREMMQLETDPYIIQQGIRVVGIPQNSQVILNRMELLIQQPGATEDVKKDAQAVIQQIREKQKP